MHVLLHSLPPTLQQAPTNPRLRWRLLDATGQVWVSLFWVTAPSSWVLVHTSFCLCPPRVYLPVLCKFWQLYDGVNVDLIQEGLCNTQVCCTQSPCPCSSPLLTCASTGDTQAQFCLSLCGVSVSSCTQGLFEPSERLWQLWGWILNVISPLLPSCWGFFFAPGHGYLLKVTPSPHSCCSSAVQPPLQHLPSCWSFSQVALTRCQICQHLDLRFVRF